MNAKGAFLFRLSLSFKFSISSTVGRSSPRIECWHGVCESTLINPSSTHPIWQRPQNDPEIRKMALGCVIYVINIRRKPVRTHASIVCGIYGRVCEFGDLPVRPTVMDSAPFKVGDTKTYRATQGPQLLRDWSVMGDRGGGATSTAQCRLYQIKACQSSARRTPSVAEIILLQFQTWLLTCEIKH